MNRVLGGGGKGSRAECKNLLAAQPGLMTAKTAALKAAVLKTGSLYTPLHRGCLLFIIMIITGFFSFSF